MILHKDLIMLRLKIINKYTFFLKVNDKLYIYQISKTTYIPSITKNQRIKEVPNCHAILFAKISEMIIKINKICCLVPEKQVLKRTKIAHAAHDWRERFAL